MDRPDSPGEAPSAAETLRRLEVAALIRLGLGSVLARLTEARPGEPALDALRRVGALALPQVLAARAYVERNRLACACGRVLLAEEGGDGTTCPGCGQVVQRETGGAARARSSPGEAPRLGAGERLGPFELLGELGRGANGRVFKARHTELGRVSALKVVPGAARDATRRRRFEREVVAQARLAHPGIVGIHSSLAVGDALAFEMDLVEGESLRDRLDRTGALPWREAARIVAEVARAIEHLHARGLVHRDLKPANILLRKSDGAAIVTDLGIARIVDQASSLTQDGALLGTPAYMAPESIGGEAGPPSDVYALGVTLYECVTGELPYEEAELLRLLFKIAHGTCAPISRTDVPVALEAIRARAMAVDPRQRYPSAGALANDLEHLRVQAAPERLGDVAAPPRRLARLALVLLAAAAPLALLALALALRPRREQREAAVRAVLERVQQDCETDPRAAAAGLRALEQDHGGRDLDVPGVAAQVARLELRLGEPARALAALAHVAPAERSRLALVEAQALRSRGDPAAALEKLPRTGREGSLAVSLLLELGRTPEALALADGLARAAGADRAQGLLARGEVHLAQQDLLAARADFLEADRVDPRAGAGAGLAEVCLALDAPEDALPLAEAAVRAAPREPWSFYARAGARLRTRDLAHAIPDLEHARALGPTVRACLEGRALARDLVAHVPHGAWGRASVREARRGALEAIEWRVPEVAPSALAEAETVAAAFSGSASAHASLGIAFALLPMSQAQFALDEADAALALDPTDAVAATLRAHMLASLRGYEAGLQALETVSEADDHEALASGLRTRSLDPSSLEQSRADFALGVKDAARARAAIARGAPRAALRLDREGFLRLDAQAAQLAGDAARAQELDLARGWLEPWRADDRAALLHEHAHTKTGVVERIAQEPWDPAHHAIRNTAHVPQPLAQDVWDDFVAAVQDVEFLPRCFIYLLHNESLRAIRSELAAKDLDPIQNLASKAVADRLSPESLDLPPTSNPVEAAASELTKANFALSARDTLGWSPGVASLKALAYVRAAEDAHLRTPLIHAFRALALEQIDAPRAAARERTRFARLVSPAIDAAFAVVRRRYLVDPRTTEAGLANRLVSELESRRAAAERVPLEDLHGWDRLVFELGQRWCGIPSRTRILVPQTPPDGRPLPRGWRIEVKDGETRLVGVPPTDALELDLGGDILSAELLLDPHAGPLLVEVPGARFQVQLDRSEARRETIPLVAGVPRPGRVKLRTDEGTVVITCMFSRSRIPPEEEPLLKTDVARAFELAHPGWPKNAKNVDDALAKGAAPGELCWRAAADALKLGGLTAEANVQAVYQRLLERAPTAEEQRAWVERLGSSGDASLVVRVLARSAEFRAKNRF